MILIPDDFKIAKSLKQVIRKGSFEIRFDSAFKEVIKHCSEISRRDQYGTWITPEMIKAYIALHQAGYAHSVEAYKEGKLAGGLYGVSIGKVFFGESMFFKQRDASKAALFALVERLKTWSFHFIDAQQNTRHLESLGAKTISRKKFLTMLENALKFETKKGIW
jgi:leucyl/phenylalanyl-tRNA--protein transferase